MERRSTKDWVCGEIGGCHSFEECEINCQEQANPPMITHYLTCNSTCNPVVLGMTQCCHCCWGP